MEALESARPKLSGNFGSSSSVHAVGRCLKSFQNGKSWMSGPYFNARLVSMAMHMEFGGKTRKSVMMTLAKFANREGVCWPGQQVLMDLVGCSERTLRRALKGLEDDGHIRRRRRNRRDGSRDSDLYELVSLMPTGHFVQEPTGQNDRGNTKEPRSIKEKISDSLRSSGATCDDDQRFPDWKELPGDRVAEQVSERTVKPQASATRERVAVDEPLQGVLVVPEKSATVSVISKELDEFQAMRSRVAEYASQLLEPAKPLTVNQRAGLMAKVYYEAVNGMCQFVAVQQICKKAINSGRYEDRQVIEALWKMGRENRPVTATSLMVAIDKPFSQNKSWHQQQTDDLFDRWEQRIQEYKKAGLA